MQWDMIPEHFLDPESICLAMGSVSWPRTAESGSSSTGHSVSHQNLKPCRPIPGLPAVPATSRDEWKSLWSVLSELGEAACLHRTLTLSYASEELLDDTASSQRNFSIRRC